MKKLFLKNGTYEYAKVRSDSTGEYIEIYVKEIDPNFKLVYSIFKGKSPMNNKVIFPKDIKEMPLFETLVIAEIYQNFTQHFNNINQ